MYPWYIHVEVEVEPEVAVATCVHGVRVFVCGTSRRIQTGSMFVQSTHTKCTTFYLLYLSLIVCSRRLFFLHANGEWVVRWQHVHRLIEWCNQRKRSIQADTSVDKQ